MNFWTSIADFDQTITSVSVGANEVHSIHHPTEMLFSRGIEFLPRILPEMCLRLFAGFVAAYLPMERDKARVRYD
jgi:hypothetical protein